jgi:hypothetical protein
MKHSTQNYTHNKGHATQSDYKQSQQQLYKLIYIKKLATHQTVTKKGRVKLSLCLTN